MNSDLRRRAIHHGKADQSPTEDSRPPGSRRNGGSRTEESSLATSITLERTDEAKVETGSRERLAYKRRSSVVIKRSRSESIRSDHSDP